MPFRDFVANLMRLFHGLRAGIAKNKLNWITLFLKSGSIAALLSKSPTLENPAM
jgi:hypothetical protein